MVRALDFAFAANEDETSPYYHKLDTTQVAALGHSQGGAATIATADDKRVTAAIIYNGGKSASKPFLTISADRDIPGIGASSGADLKPGVDAAPKAAFIFYHMVPMTGQYDGHLTLMLQPERVGDPSIKFLDLLLKQDATAKEWFVGANCKLCNMAANLEFGEHGLD
jgi:pimeloyl-ACP methyl ester carboxylesterase